MKTIYLDINYVSQKYVSGGAPSNEPVVYADYIKSDLAIVSCGFEYEKDEVTYRSFYIGFSTNPFNDDILINFQTEIKNSKGEWKFVELIQVSAKRTFYRYNNPLLPSFSLIEENPFDEDGNLKANLVDEIVFFNSNVGANPNNLPLSLFQFFLGALVTRI
jgi:hypothetical protein